MGWFGLVKLFIDLLHLAQTVLGYLGRKESGRAKAKVEQLESSLDAVTRADKARSDALSDLDRRDGVPDDKDPNLRD